MSTAGVALYSNYQGSLLVQVRGHYRTPRLTELEFLPTSIDFRASLHPYSTISPTLQRLTALPS